MGWSFRRRIKVIPGVYLNVSKRGVSTTVGVRGASLTFRGDGTYANVGIPGTGISNRQKLSGRRSENSSSFAVIPPEATPHLDQSSTPSPDYLYVSSDPLDITSEGLLGFQTAVIEANKQSLALKKDLASIQFSILLSRILAIALKCCILYYLVPAFRRSIDQRLFAQSQAIAQVKEAISSSSVPLELEMEQVATSKYNEFIDCFADVLKSQFIWDITSASDVDRVKTRSAANLAISRSKTGFALDSVPGISSSYPSVRLRNLNGADIFIYPGFFVMYDSPIQLGVLELSKLSISFERSQFVEQEIVPLDSKRVGEVWERSNKDGSRDKRYADNKLIPVMEYGEITFRSSSGVHEKYMISDARNAERFASALTKFVSCIS